MAVSAYAQKTTNGTGGGKWSQGSTWQGGAVPSPSENVNILATDSIHFDVAVTLTGTVKNLSGKAGSFDSSQVVFGNGGVYEHAANGGSLPKATWNQGSTCLITGVTGNVPNNSAQNFYNLTWNCPGQSAGLNLGMFTQTIGGNVRVINSATLAIRLTAANIAVPVGRKLITINGNVYVDSSTAFFTATGSGSPNDTFSVVVKGNIVSKGRIDIANGGGGMVTWFVGGDIDVSAGQFTTHSSAPLADTLVFNGTAKQTFKRGGAVTSANIRFVVASGSIVDFDTSTVGGSAASTFRLHPGATIISGRSNGFKGNLNNGGGTTLSPAANYEYDGSVAQSDELLRDTVNNLTLNNSAGFTLLQATVINGVLALKAGELDNTIPFTLGPSGSISYQGGTLKVPVTSVRSRNELGIPATFVVNQNFPNPFNPSTTISFGLPVQSTVSVKVFNIVGQEVASLFSGTLNDGMHDIPFDASRFGSGVYLYQIQAGSFSETKRMVLTK
jgi:hypothetical protein